MDCANCNYAEVNGLYVLCNFTGKCPNQED